MTTNQQPRPLIEYPVVKPFIDAAALGLAIGGPSAFSGNFWPGFVGGASFSLLWYWGRGNVAQGKKRATRARSIPINTHKGQQNLRFEQVAPGYITRQPFWTDVKGLFGKPSRPRVMRSPVKPDVPQLDSLKEFAFISYDKSGNEVQILAGELWLFLSRAWLYRDKGRGLGGRFWGKRGAASWPSWYTGVFFYQACYRLIVQAQRGLDVQLVVSMGHQQVGLKWPARKTYNHILAWYLEGVSENEIVRQRNQSDSPDCQSEIIGK